MRVFHTPITRESSAREKMRIIRDQVVKPATTGPGLAQTRAILAEILAGAPKNVNGHTAGRWAMIQRIFHWVRGRVRYVLDPNKKELFQEIQVTLKEGIGDCDDFTGVLGALLKAAGFAVKARCIALKQDGPYVHIFPVVNLNGRWIALDATTPNPPGWSAKFTRHLDLEL